MNKEIEEILYMLKSVVDDPKSTFQANATTCYLLLDYITNLQEENERLGKLFYERNEENIKLKKNINKAIEYIKNNQLYEEEWDYDSNDEPFSWGCNDDTATNDLLSILRGENK